MDVEIIQISIPLEDYELRLAKLIENLLLIDEMLNTNDKELLKTEAA